MSGKCFDPADGVGDTIVLALDLMGFKTGQHQSIATGLRTPEVAIAIQDDPKITTKIG